MVTRIGFANSKEGEQVVCGLKGVDISGVMGVDGKAGRGDDRNM